MAWDFRKANLFYFILLSNANFYDPNFSLLAFYISFDFGPPYIHEVFKTPLISLFSVVVMLVNDILAVYDNMVVSKYAVVGRVRKRN